MSDTQILEELSEREYQHGFVTDIEADSAPPGLDEGTIAFISAKKEEPQWLLDWRLKAYRNWLKMEDPTKRKQSERWAMVDYPSIDYQDIIVELATRHREEPPSSIDQKIHESSQMQRR